MRIIRVPQFPGRKCKLLPWPEIAVEYDEVLRAYVRREAERRRRLYQAHEPFFLKPFGCCVEASDDAISIDWNSLLGHELESVVEAMYRLSRREVQELYRDLNEALCVHDYRTEQGFDDDEGDDDDGTAAPLWRLFRHKPWQKVLKETWTKLEAGDYDWAHLAMAYWPERVRAKCRSDKSLAIAHGLEELYVPHARDASRA